VEKTARTTRRKKSKKGRWLNLSELPLNQIICSDALDFLRKLPPESIDLVITSPPYWGLRDYSEHNVKIWDDDPNCEHEWDDNSFCKKCDAWKGQLGLEPSWKLYIKHLTDIFREVKRVLKKSGSMYIVLGDTYASKPTGSLGKTGWSRPHSRNQSIEARKHRDLREIPQKCLMGLPWRFAFAMIEDGWILRNCIIWFKPNALPSSVKDRFSNKYEYIFFFTKSPRYYFNLDSVREPHKTLEKFTKGVEMVREIMNQEEYQYNTKYLKVEYSPLKPQAFSREQSLAKARAASRKVAEQLFPDDKELQQEFINYVHDHMGSPLGKNPGDVIKWSDPNSPVVKHFRSKGSGGHFDYGGLHSPEGRHYHEKGKNPGDFWEVTLEPFKDAHFAVFPLSICWKPILASCPPDGVVLDIFAGSGTVGEATILLNIFNRIPSKDEVKKVKEHLEQGIVPLNLKANRKFILVDINPDYCQIMEKRLKPYRNLCLVVQNG